MKPNLLFKMFIFFIAVLFFSVSAFSQEAGQQPNYGTGFETFTALVALIPVVTEIFKKSIPNASSLGVQIFSWIIGIAITVFGWIFGIGFLAGLDWYVMLLYGVGASLAANGIFDTGLIAWIVALFSRKK